MMINSVSEWQPPDGQPGRGRLIGTERGDIQAILHEDGATRRAIVWVWGIRGGFDGPAESIYRSMSEELKGEIASLRVNYRHPTEFDECVYDTLAGVAYLDSAGYDNLALIGHSLGGAVVISAAPRSPHVKAVVALSSQTLGARDVADVSPRPLLLVHGANDRNLPVECSQAIYEWAREPKELVIYHGAGHGLRQCKDEVHELLRGWLTEKLQNDQEEGPDA